MNQYVTAQDRYLVDKLTIQKFGLPSPVLMERAALSFVDLFSKLAAKSKNILIMVGRGNNGGDGLAIARLLYLKGYNVSIYSLPGSHCSKEYSRQLNMVEQLEIKVLTEENLDICSFDIIIDSLFGIGLDRPIKGEAAKILSKINQQIDNFQIWAVDMPSGFSAAGGRFFEPFLPADHTVTFGFLLDGMQNPENKAIFGDIHLTDIGYPTQWLQKNLKSL